jgi:hypothetical protein
MTSDQTKTSLLFRRDAETVAGNGLYSHFGAMPLIFCDHTVSSRLSWKGVLGACAHESVTSPLFVVYAHGASL